MESNLLNEGLALMAFGMGFVFVFLTLLVIATTLMSKALTAWLPETPPEPLAPVRPQPSVGSNGVDPNVLKVLQEAINQHRGRS